MPEIFHIRIKKEYAASLIEHLIDEDAVEKIEEKDIDLPDEQKRAIDSELAAISSDSNYLKKWNDVKHQFKPR